MSSLQTTRLFDVAEIAHGPRRPFLLRSVVSFIKKAKRFLLNPFNAYASFLMLPLVMDHMSRTTAH